MNTNENTGIALLIVTFLSEVNHGQHPARIVRADSFISFKDFQNMALLTEQQLNAVKKAIKRIDQIIECTYAHDEDGERLEDEASEHSAADIVEMLTDAENIVADAWNALN